ncbi:MAG: SMP-30/gluconolactonase/LRE family protein [Fidelibacterota bacterium]
MRLLFKFIITLVLVAAVYVVINYRNIPHMTPLRFVPPVAPEMTGPLQPNDLLQSAVRLLDGQVSGPEDVMKDSNGNLFIANSDGTIIKYTSEGDLIPFFRSTGRPLGMTMDSQGNLVVCHTNLGLITLTPDGEMDILVSNGDQFHLIDDLTISADDVVYFTDASSLDELESFYYDILLHHPLGCVWEYDLKTGKLSKLIEGLYFANGIQLSPDGSFLLVNETSAYRIRKVWLKGSKRGESEVFLDNLPGFPDGLDKSSDGTYWVSLASPRKKEVDTIYHPRPWLKRILMYLPEVIRPSPTRYGLILKIDIHGNILNSYHDTTGDVLWSITNVFEADNYLYVGSLFNDAVGVWEIPD